MADTHACKQPLWLMPYLLLADRMPLTKISDRYFYIVFLKPEQIEFLMLVFMEHACGL